MSSENYYEPVDVGFTFFRTLTLDHLDAAWYSLSKQNFDGVRHIHFFDNNTDYDWPSISRVLTRYQMKVPVYLHSEKHGDLEKTQSYSVNRVCRDFAQGPGIFFCRADYLLREDFIQKCLEIARKRSGEALFISGWCWQMAYNRETENIDAPVDIEQYEWRTKGFNQVLKHPYAHRFHETDQDAGCWFTSKIFMAKADWMNEDLTSWGYQQSEFQRMLTKEAGVQCIAIQEYMFAHLHHWAPRSFAVANEEWHKFGRG